MQACAKICSQNCYAVIPATDSLLSPYSSPTNLWLANTFCSKSILGDTMQRIIISNVMICSRMCAQVAEYLKQDLVAGAEDRLWPCFQGSATPCRSLQHPGHPFQMERPCGPAFPHGGARIPAQARPPAPVLQPHEEV